VRTRAFFVALPLPDVPPAAPTRERGRVSVSTDSCTSPVFTNSSPYPESHIANDNLKHQHLPRHNNYHSKHHATTEIVGDDHESTSTAVLFMTPQRNGRTTPHIGSYYPRETSDHLLSHQIYWYATCSDGISHHRRSTKLVR